MELSQHFREVCFVEAEFQQLQIFFLQHGQIAIVSPESFVGNSVMVKDRRTDGTIQRAVGHVPCIEAGGCILEIVRHDLLCAVEHLIRLGLSLFFRGLPVRKVFFCHDFRKRFEQQDILHGLFIFRQKIRVDKIQKSFPVLQSDDGPAEHIVLRDQFFFMVIVVPVPQLLFILFPVDLIPAAQTIITEDENTSWDFWTLRMEVQDEYSPLAERDDAVENMRELAENGDVHAQYFMGKLYLDGSLVIPDSEAAMNWFHKASTSGYAPAQYALGKLLLSDDASVHDSEAGIQWLEHAAYNGNHYASYRLGKRTA